MDFEEIRIPINIPNKTNAICDAPWMLVWSIDVLLLFVHCDHIQLNRRYHSSKLFVLIRVFEPLLESRDRRFALTWVSMQMFFLNKVEFKSEAVPFCVDLHVWNFQFTTPLCDRCRMVF